MAVGEFWRLSSKADSIPLDVSITIILGVLIGGVTLTGSFVAFAKLQGILKGAPITFPLQQPVNALLLVGLLAGSVYLCVTPASTSILLGGLLPVIPAASTPQ